MSEKKEKKFNLKNYQKINGNEHIDMRLEQAREGSPDVINEKQLESYRATEADVGVANVSVGVSSALTVIV